VIHSVHKLSTSGQPVGNSRVSTGCTQKDTQVIHRVLEGASVWA